MSNLFKKTGTIALLLVILCSVFYFLLGPQYLYEWDSVNYALGAAEYDLNADQPHAPGYPLWILLMRLVMLTGAGPNLAQILLANIFTVLAMAWLYALARAWYGSRVALFCTVILFTSPLVALYSAVALNYSVDLFASCALAYLAFRLARKEYRLAPLALGLLVLLAGIRQSGSMYLVPLVAFYFLVSCRRRPGWALLSLAVGGVLGAAWLIPTLNSAGGWNEYLALCRSQTSDSFTLTSVFFGAGWDQQIRSAVKALFFLGMGLGIPLAVSVVLSLFGRIRARGNFPVGDNPRAWLFFGLWLLPGLAFVLLFHAPKPGYVLVLLPGLCLALAVRLGRTLGESGLRTGVVLVLVAVLNLTLFLLPYDSLTSGRLESLGRRMGHCGLASIRHSDQTMAGVLTAITHSDVPSECCYVVAFGGRFGTDYRGPNWRKLVYYLPDYRVGYVDSQLLESSAEGVREVSGFDLAACTTRIWWVIETKDLGQAVMSQFPDTVEQYQEGRVSLLASSTPPDFSTLEFNLKGCRVQFRKLP